MPLGYVARDVKAEAHTVGVAGASIGSAEGWLEGPCSVFFGDPWAVVDHFERPGIVVAFQDDGYVAGRAVVSNCVLDDISERLLKECEIAQKLDRRLRGGELERHLLSGGDGAMPVADSFRAAAMALPAFQPLIMAPEFSSSWQEPASPASRNRLRYGSATGV